MTDTTWEPTPPPTTTEPPTWRRPAIDAALVLLGFALVAAALGWLWWELWGPAATGKVYAVNNPDPSKIWLPDPYEAGERKDFTDIAIFVLLSGAGGLILGALAAGFVKRKPLFTLAAVVVGSALAAYVMYTVGTSLSAPDPDKLALTSPEGKVLPGSIRFPGFSPFLVWPTAALIGSLATNVLVAYITDTKASRRDQGQWLSQNQIG